MIIEAIVTTVNDQGVLNIAPMGPKVGPDLSLRRFELRPFRSSTTYRNLMHRGEGVLHITDDVLLFAQSAVGQPLDPKPEIRRAAIVDGWILARSCRYYEFRCVEIEDPADRARLAAETVAEGRIRDFLGFNRARHAVVEAAILATRVDLLPGPEILDEFRRLSPLVEKTGGPTELAAFARLQDFVTHSIDSRHLEQRPSSS